MGRPGGARLEEVQAFARDVVAYMAGFGTYVSCGCGYLSLRVTGEETAQAFLEREDILEPTTFTPTDLEAYFREKILLESSGVTELAQTCDPRTIQDTLREL